jgi:hypothetical protein
MRILIGSHSPIWPPSPVLQISLRFYRKTYVHYKNVLKICISFPWDPYYVSIKLFDVVHKFLGVLKILNIGPKPNEVSLWVYRKMFVRDKKTSEKSIFLVHEGHLLHRLDVNVLYINF